MRVAVVSDIHSNWEAFNLVLRDADASGAEAIWCLGDLVGYGPDPNRCWLELAEMRQRQISPGAWVAGNHEWGLIGSLVSAYFIEVFKDMDGPMMAGYFGQHAWQDILRQREALRGTPAAEMIARLPLLASPFPGIYLFHGAYLPEPPDPPRNIIGTYAKVPEFAERSLTHLLSFAADPQAFAHDGIARSASQGWARPLLMLAGHTHRACAWRPRDGAPSGDLWEDLTAQLLADGVIYVKDLSRRPLFANPGSVGFPRDCRAGLASYMLVDWEITGVRLWLRRIPYDPGSTIAKMRLLGTSQLVIQQLEPPQARAAVPGNSAMPSAVFSASHLEEKAL